MIKLIEKTFKIDITDFPVLLRDIIYIIVFSIFIAFAVNIFHPKGFKLVNTSNEKLKNMIYISSDEAMIKNKCNSAVFVDSRPEDEFELSHIPGAINIPAIPSSISAKKIKENFGLLASEKELILYCDGLSCGSSETLAKTMIEMGYSKHIYVIKNGLPEWQKKGYPVEK